MATVRSQHHAYINKIVRLRLSAPDRIQLAEDVRDTVVKVPKGVVQTDEQKAESAPFALRAMPRHPGHACCI